MRDDPRLVRSSTDSAVMEPQPRLASGAALAAASDAAVRDDVSPLTQEVATADVGAAPEVAPPRSMTGGLEGRVLFDGGITASDLRARVDRISSFEGDAVLGVLPIALNDDGSFRFDDLELGTLQVFVVGRAQGAFEPLAPVVLADVHADDITRVDDIAVRRRAAHPRTRGRCARGALTRTVSDTGSATQGSKCGTGAP